MNAEEICNAVGAGSMTEERGIEELIKLGYDRETAKEEIFIAQGGHDVVEESHISDEQNDDDGKSDQ